VLRDANLIIATLGTAGNVRRDGGALLIVRVVFDSDYPR
jgi:hypothetical protein